MKTTIFSIGNIVNIIKSRQNNEFDANVIVSGDRGNGKSTLINKTLYRFPDFRRKQKYYQVYQRKDVIHLLKTERKGICWDDEAINSGYKRNFQDRGQQELIKIMTAYRDHYNAYFSAIPNFFSLDKDLRDLCFLHLHVIERGVAVVHAPLQGKLYSPDKWDVKNNAKVEERWSKNLLRNPDFKPKYNQLSTFKGYLYFKPLTKLQEKVYKDIKRFKKKDAFRTDDEKQVQEDLSFVDKLFQIITDGKTTKESLHQMCLLNGKKYSNVSSALNKVIKDKNLPGTLKDYLFIQKTAKEKSNKEIKSKLQDLIPDFS